MRLLVVAASLFAFAVASAHADPIGTRRLVFAQRLTAGGAGFIDLASLHNVGDHKEGEALLVSRTAGPGQLSHILAQVAFDCVHDRAEFLGGQGFDSDDRPLDRIDGGHESMGDLDTITRALVCGGPGAPANPRVFPTTAAAAEWARSGGT